MIGTPRTSNPDDETATSTVRWSTPGTKGNWAASAEASEPENGRRCRHLIDPMSTISEDVIRLFPEFKVDVIRENASKSVE